MYELNEFVSSSGDSLFVINFVIESLVSGLIDVHRLMFPHDIGQMGISPKLFSWKEFNSADVEFFDLIARGGISSRLAVMTRDFVKKFRR